MAFFWDDHPKVEKKLSELYDEYGNDWALIAEKLNEEFKDINEFTYYAVRNRVRRSNIIQYLPNKRGKGLFKDLYDDDIIYDYEETKSHILQVMDKFKNKYGNSKIKSIALSDLHIPYTDMDALEKAILCNQDAKICVMSGDLLDYYSLSSFGNSRNISVTKEFKKGYKILEVISKIFDWIIIINGNHEARLKKYFKNKIVLGLNGYLMDKHKPLQEITRYFDNVDYIDHWFCQLGDVIYAHPKSYSSVTLRTVENTIKYFIKQRHELIFDNFNFVIIGHTHRIGRAECLGRYGYEIGHLMNPNIDYKHEDIRSNKWEQGYGIIEFINGQGSYNGIKEIKL